MGSGVPPIDVDLIDGANQSTIGVVLEGGSAQNEMVVILTLYSAVISLTVGTGGVTRGEKVKTDASGDIVPAVTADVGTAATGATETRVIGVALQTGAAADVIYVGLTH